MELARTATFCSAALLRRFVKGRVCLVGYGWEKLPNLATEAVALQSVIQNHDRFRYYRRDLDAAR